VDANQKVEQWRGILQYSQQLKVMNAEFGKLYYALRSELDAFLKE
jgi:hypothetical protein